MLVQRHAARHAAMTYPVALRLCGNHHDAQDITQEALIAAWEKNSPGSRANSSFSTWLYQIVTRRAGPALYIHSMRASRHREHLPAPAQPKRPFCPGQAARTRQMRYKHAGGRPTSTPSTRSGRCFLTAPATMERARALVPAAPMAEERSTAPVQHRETALRLPKGQSRYGSASNSAAVTSSGSYATRVCLDGPAPPSAAAPPVSESQPVALCTT
jgi:Sigma-70 region 2